MRLMRLYHGGKAGLRPGALLVPSPPVIEDDCPICLERAAGRVPTVGLMRAWARQVGGPGGASMLRLIEGEPDSAPLDPPSARDAVYVTSSIEYARWYAARSGGDLYEVAAEGALTPSTEDHWPTWTCPSARVLRVVERPVRLDRRDRRALMREWEKRDRARAGLREQSAAAIPLA